MKKIVYCVCLFFTAHAFAVFLSVSSDFNSYVQVYDSMGSIIAADFAFPGKTIEANTGVLGLDRARWLGSNKKVYEYRFDSSKLGKNNTLKIQKDDTHMVNVNGSMASTGDFQSRLTLLYE